MGRKRGKERAHWQRYLCNLEKSNARARRDGDMGKELLVARFCVIDCVCMILAQERDGEHSAQARGPFNSRCKKMARVHSGGSLVSRPKPSHRSILPTTHYTRRMNNRAKGGTKEESDGQSRQVTRHGGVNCKVCK